MCAISCCWHFPNRIRKFTVLTGFLSILVLIRNQSTWIRKHRDHEQVGFVPGLGLAGIRGKSSFCEGIQKLIYIFVIFFVYIVIILCSRMTLPRRWSPWWTLRRRIRSSKSSNLLRVSCLHCPWNVFGWHGDWVGEWRMGWPLPWFSPGHGGVTSYQPLDRYQYHGTLTITCPAPYHQLSIVPRA